MAGGATFLDVTHDAPISGVRIPGAAGLRHGEWDESASLLHQAHRLLLRMIPAPAVPCSTHCANYAVTALRGCRPLEMVTRVPHRFHSERRDGFLGFGAQKGTRPGGSGRPNPPGFRRRGGKRLPAVDDCQGRHGPGSQELIGSSVRYLDCARVLGPNGCRRDPRVRPCGFQE